MMAKRDPDTADLFGWTPPDPHGYVTKWAHFHDEDPASLWRYALGRTWEPPEAAPDRGCVNFLMLNPSTADALQDDRTVRRCAVFAKEWGYSSLVVTNLFAYRATKPADMKAADDPVGPENDQWVNSMADTSDALVLACGNHGKFLNRFKRVLLEVLPDTCTPLALAVNKSGHPKHPLYVEGAALPLPYALASIGIDHSVREFPNMPPQVAPPQQPYVRPDRAGLLPWTGGE